MLEFKVNEYITLKLEGKITNIYIEGELFRQCKYLLLNIPRAKTRKYRQIDSIDEAEEKLDRSMESGRVSVPSEAEFWGHCSNLQAWAENDYDTRILHRNLAFPLLERLYLAGDPKATQILKEEIAYRYESGYLPVRKYLQESGYMSYLSDIESTAIDYEPKYVARSDHLDIMVLGDQEVGRRTLVDYIVEGRYKPVEDRFPDMPNLSIIPKHLVINDKAN